MRQHGFYEDDNYKEKRSDDYEANLWFLIGSGLFIVLTLAYTFGG
jgi:hypothetical protein